MKLKFKIQPFQTEAVESIVDCCSGQVNTSGVTFRIDPGARITRASQGAELSGLDIEQTGFRNAEIQLPDDQLLSNIQSVQRRQNLPLSDRLVVSAGCKVNLDVEMETGTGKTYCYIKTIFELNKRYGWSKFIVVVPSIAIREGVYKSFDITADHFTETYGKKVRFFIYNSRQLHHLESFSSDAGINVMIINIQAFNASGKDNRRIYEELDDFQSRKPIDVISSNRPILILDEPQKMEGDRTMESLAKFRPLMILRYSATHRTTHNLVYRLDALDAYNQKLVKKIAVRGIGVRGLAGTSAYLYLDSIEISRSAPIARIEMEVIVGSGIKRIVRRLERGKDLFVVSGELEQYQEGYVISQIDAVQNQVEFTNGLTLKLGDVYGDVTEAALRKIQIREAIKAHLEQEKRLFSQGVKVLSLFFIDEVKKYRDYDREDTKGEYARYFEEVYQEIRDEYLGELPLDNEVYRRHLQAIPVEKTHTGYFSIDKRGGNRLVDPSVRSRGDEAGLSDDVDAYDLILKDKERLLSFEEPARFIFSHSALREGWDNPNVFVMCMLKHSDSTISRRQEVGRGLRISVNRNGDRMDNPATVHDINVLTVVASESYKDFVSNLQREISEALASRPRIANVEYFAGKILNTESGPVEVTRRMAQQIYHYLAENRYTNTSDQITQIYRDEKQEGILAPLPEELVPYEEPIHRLIGSLYSDDLLPEFEDGRKGRQNRLNENFHKREFQELWNRINHKAVYRVEFDTEELIGKAVRNLDGHLTVTPLTYVIQSGQQRGEMTEEQLRSGVGFVAEQTATEQYSGSIHSLVKYDLLGKVCDGTQLTRRTVARILTAIRPETFGKFRQNPEQFISQAITLINEEKASIIIERLSYDQTTERHGSEIFTSAEQREDIVRAGEKLKKHVFDYAVTDSKVERSFVEELDTSEEVVVYAKLPKGFVIPTPVGGYNPDWAISFKERAVRHVYFVAETKGSLESLQLRRIEETKISCARKFFQRLNEMQESGKVHYDVVESYSRLMDLVRAN